MNLIDHLWERAETRAHSSPEEDFRLRGLWEMSIRFQPNPAERLFRYNTVIAQTLGQGVCYAFPDHSFDLNSNFIGNDAFHIDFDDPHVEIAVLDAIYSAFDLDPNKSYEIEGYPRDKSIDRTEILVEEILNLSDGIDSPSIVNIGVLGNVINALNEKNIEVHATDFEDQLVGSEINETVIKHGDRNYKLIEECDIALVTGMTLSTRTLRPIIDAAKNNDTKLIVYAETGSNFAEEYCSLGVDVVVSEPFPFYIFEGVSTIDIYYPSTQ